MTGTPSVPSSGCTVIRLNGGLDLAAAPELREQLIDVLHRGTELLILDLSQVQSCDAAGLAVLIGTQRRARQLGLSVRLAGPAPRWRTPFARPAWSAASPSARTVSGHSSRVWTSQQVPLRSPAMSAAARRRATFVPRHSPSRSAMFGRR